MERTIATATGTFAAIDYGGKGPNLLFIHGTGHNAEVWRDTASHLQNAYRMLAFDMRGHGQTVENSRDPEQYWRDIGAVIDAAELHAPLLVGHSTGAYAACAFAASGGACTGVVCIDGFVLDSRTQAVADTSQRDFGALAAQLQSMFRYGWAATEKERDAYIADVLSQAHEDWLNRGVLLPVLERVMRRAFFPMGGKWLRRPSVEEIAVVSGPSATAAIYPSREIYDRISEPLTLVWARHGLSAHRREDVEAIAAGHANRRFIALDASHNVPMQKPVELADLLAHLEVR